MSDEHLKLIEAQVLYLRALGWTSDGDGMWAKPGTSEFTWDCDHAILCEHSGHRDLITGYQPIIAKRTGAAG